MECCVGKYISEECHKSVYGDVHKEIKVISEYKDSEQQVLKFRISDSIVNICKYHEIKFLEKYYHFYGRICCDPLKCHRKPVKKSLREITLTHLSRPKSNEVKLIPGKALCSTCNKKLFKLTHNEDEDPLDKLVDPNFEIPETIHVVDQTCYALGISPASKIRKLSSDKRPSAIESKVSKISETLKRKLYANLDEDHECLADSLPMQNENQFDCNEYEQLITKLKEKLQVSNKEEKIKIISLLLNKDLIIPSKRTAIIKKGYTHLYKWPRRTKNIVYPPKGPSVKECSVKIHLLSKSMVKFWLGKKCEKSTMTPDEWQDNNLTICACQKIPIIVLDDESTSAFKNKSSSTRCKCEGSKTQSKPQQNSQEIENTETSNKEMISSERSVIDNHRNVAEKMSYKNRSFTNTCDSGKEMKVSYLDKKETFCGFSLIHNESILSSKRILHRRPLAVVPSEPVAINEELAVTTSVTYNPDGISTTPSIKHNNVFRSLSDAVKWYTKDEPIEVSDRIRESLLKEGIMFGNNRSQENIKPFTDMTLPGSKMPMDYFKIDVNLSERDYCFERSSCGASKLVTRRGERHYVNREPCPSCFQGKDNFCVYEFIRQAKLAGITLFKNPKQLKLLFFKYVHELNSKD